MKVKYYYKDETIFEGEWENAPNKICHRETGPAIEYSSGTKCWWVNGKRHREDGPAVEWNNESKEWWLDGQEYAQEEFNKILKEINSLEPALGLLDPREWVRNRWKKRMKVLI